MKYFQNKLGLFNAHFSLSNTEQPHSQAALSELETPQLNTFTSALIQEHQNVTAASGAEISTHLTKKALKETEILFTNCAFASENWK